MTAYSEMTHSSLVYLWLAFDLNALSVVLGLGGSYFFHCELVDNFIPCSI